MVVLTAMAGIVLLIGAGLASYHVGVEQHWWASVASCSDASDQALSIKQFQALLQQEPEKACDEVDWTMFGISMATYNLAFCSVLGLGGLWAAITMRAA